MAGNSTKHTTIGSSQSRSKKTKTLNASNATQQNMQVEQHEEMIEAEEGEDEWEDATVMGWKNINVGASKTFEHLSKEDPWPRNFRKAVKDRHATVLDELQRQARERDASKRDFEDQFLDLIAGVLSPLESTSVQPRPIPLPKTKPEDQALFLRSRNLLEESKKLLDQYDTLSRQQPDSSSLQNLSSRFTVDKAELQAAVAAGRRIAQADIEGLLAERYHEVRGGASAGLTASEDEKNGQKLLDVGKGQREEMDEMEGWGNVAYKAQKGFDKLFKVTAMEE